MVITAGHGTNDVLATLAGCALQAPIIKDRPSEATNFIPPPERRCLYTAGALPVIAYLDAGVYVHPIVFSVIDEVKVGDYNSPDIPRDRTGVRDIADFVARVMPGLADVPFSDVLDVDQCDWWTSPRRGLRFRARTTRLPCRPARPCRRSSWTLLMRCCSCIASSCARARTT